MSNVDRFPASTGTRGRLEPVGSVARPHGWPRPSRGTRSATRTGRAGRSGTARPRWFSSSNRARWWRPSPAQARCRRADPDLLPGEGRVGARHRAADRAGGVEVDGGCGRGLARDHVDDGRLAPVTRAAVGPDPLHPKGIAVGHDEQVGLSRAHLGDRHRAGGAARGLAVGEPLLAERDGHRVHAGADHGRWAARWERRRDPSREHTTSAWSPDPARRGSRCWPW
jgi:hypothetical protein